MDEALKPRLKLSTAHALLAISAMYFGLHPALAEGLADPTRPPASLVKPGDAAQAAAAAPMPTLQSVLIGTRAGGRQVAVIDGETVPLGGKFRGAVLVRMTETEVELRRGQQRQVLKLFAVPGSSSTERSK